MPYICRRYLVMETSRGNSAPFKIHHTDGTRRNGTPRAVRSCNIGALRPLRACICAGLRLNTHTPFFAHRRYAVVSRILYINFCNFFIFLIIMHLLSSETIISIFMNVMTIMVGKVFLDFPIAQMSLDGKLWQNMIIFETRRNQQACHTAGYTPA